MSTDRDTTRIVRSWIREDEHVSASRILDDVLDAVDTTPQRRSLFSARRTAQMNNTVRYLLAAAAVVVVALIGYQVFIAPNVGGPGPSPSQTETPTVEPTSSPAPSAAAAFPPAGALAVGRHPMTLNGVHLSIEFPTAGWSSNGQWGIDKGAAFEPDSMSFILWPDSAPDNVFGDPCAGALLVPPAGPSAADLATAVSTIPGIALVSGPSEVTVGGAPAQLVVFTVPETIGCAPEQFDLWEDLDNPGAARYATQRGETFYIWIIDVDGSLVWIDGEAFAGSGPEAEEEIRQIVNSIQFE